MVAAMVSLILVVNAADAVVTRSSGAVVSAAGQIDDRIKSQIRIVHATGELDKNGAWQDTNSDGDFDIFLWVKNVGVTRISAVTDSDLFLGQQGNFSRIKHQGEAGGVKPYWQYSVENGTEWAQSDTIKVTVHYSTTLATGIYLVKLVIPNGVFDELTFSM